MGNSPATGEFPAQMASNAENVSFDDVIKTALVLRPKRDELGRHLRSIMNIM